ncbi:hypothetical protein [Neisseria iguanae]|uniref:Porin n=1 Tax=Neisseria iguanae TaxID=90242 RepID=A0A2P7TYR9_9NEIS|nr:hypothetical protein [Neisseria iguanae]PSJ79868.1 hypothetical protein C7N83_09710 [Neisseria iguanae]
MRKKNQRVLFILAACISSFAMADETVPARGDTWVDSQHGKVQGTLKKWSHNMDGWFGETDPNNPASANLRVMVDTEWNKYDKFSVTPRIRGRVKLPVLQKKLNVVFGDDSLDDEFRNEASNYRNRSYRNGKKYDYRTNRDQNASIALRWNELLDSGRINTDFDIGIRSGSDLYARVKAEKDWQINNKLVTGLEQIYRYGSKSEHHVRTNWDTRYQEDGKTFISNQLHLQYEHDDDREKWTWGDNLYRQHDLGNNRYVNYGLHTHGYIENKKFNLNTYGPFAGYRQPIWRKWLFVQTEINYFNNRKADRDHNVGALVRFEALF